MTTRYSNIQILYLALKNQSHPLNWPSEHWYFTDNPTARRHKDVYDTLTEQDKVNLLNTPWKELGCVVYHPGFFYCPYIPENI